MRNLRHILLLLLLWGTASSSELFAQSRDSLRRKYDVVIKEPGNDSLEARNRQFYDSLEVKSRNKAVTRLLYDLLVRGAPNSGSTSTGKAIDETKRYRPYEGRTILSIRIDRYGAFNREGKWIERAGNSLHIETRERVILRDLLLEVGDTIDPEQLVRNMHLLRSRRYISDAELKVIPDSIDPEHFVHVYVKTRDSWSISVDGSWRSRGRTMVSIYDENIFGTGNRLEIQTHFNRLDWSYGGNLIQYKMPNMWGSFIEGFISAGRKGIESEFRADFSKPLLRPSDLLCGLSYNRLRKEFIDDNYPNIPTTLERRLDIWAGYSYRFRQRKTNLYAMAHYSHSNFRDRPPVRTDFNPVYHRSERILGSVGLYRENFYTANMIYGFGTREYIPTGYRMELTGGYNWGEFREDIYLGARLYAGGFTPAGFFSGGASVGGYISPIDGSGFRDVADADFRWFSNLWPARNCHVRQFITLNYTHGWNRRTGYNENIILTPDNGIRILEGRYSGIQRVALNTETVVFTPFQPWGFRFTCFGFLDMGFIGRSHNPFKNPFYGSVGIGVRIRNERLVFGAIQLQLGIAFGNEGWAQSDWIDLTSQDQFEHMRYLPGRPEPVPFE